MAVSMKLIRFTVVFLSLVEMLLSLLFYTLGSLYFFLEERSEVVSVSRLASQGGGENLLISLGVALFLVLLCFNLVRLKSAFGILDALALFSILAVQALALAMIEVASFSISIGQTHGWILLAWLMIYAVLWVVLTASFINRLYGNRLLP
jgi:lysylphosphatidylglycerol synthetase-like protein (DUF2156 family)